MEIIEMQQKDINQYVDLFISVFNKAPWYDHWTPETAVIRIKNMMTTNTFVGKALLDDGIPVGMIWGQKEQYYDGVHFQIQEFCVMTAAQGKGYGTILLEALSSSLAAESITHLYLITSKGERTEGFYLRKGFMTSDNMVVMGRSR